MNWSVSVGVDSVVDESKGTMASVSAHVAQTLAQHVDHVFGVMGNGNAYFLDALARRTDIGFTALRAFTPTEKLQHLTAYEQACATGEGGGGAYLREQGIYSSQIAQWRQLRDAGLLAGKKPGKKLGRPTQDQVETARLTRELEVARRRLATTEAALGIMGKAHALFGCSRSPEP